MKSAYIKPELKTFGDVEVLTEATGQSATQDFVFFNGVPLSQDDDGAYSYFIEGTSATTGPTPTP